MPILHICLSGSGLWFILTLLEAISRRGELASRSARPPGIFGKVLIMRSTFQLIICLSACLGCLTACSFFESVDTWQPAATPLENFSSDHLLTIKDHPYCKATLDAYCNYLYSPGALGNLMIKRQHQSIQILQGDTRNGFSQVFYSYSIAKIRHRRELPQDFYRILMRQNYFGKLERLLSRRPRLEMTIQQRLSDEQLDYELGSIWQAAIDETIIDRMNRKFPGYYKIPEKLMPIELDVARRKMHRILISQISQAIWKDDANWQKVVDLFQQLQKSFVHVISILDIPDSIRNDWIQRIQSVRLVLPGSMPEISDEECSTTTINAYYYYHLNVITVCAGDFNSENIMETLAHEMGHVLAINRSQYLFEKNSRMGHRLSALRQNVCEPRAFSCDQWQHFKQKFNDSLASLDTFKPELPDFQKCLQRQVTRNVLNDADYTRFAKSIMADRMSDLASDDEFLRITKAEIPLSTGKMQINPNYLNPCSYYLWSQGEEPIDDALTTLMFFTAEYRCTNDGDHLQKLRTAMATANDMSEQVIEKTLRVEGQFSDRDELEIEGFSSPPYERFADVLGSYAMADLLSHYPSKADRLNTFLASSSWQCMPPSLDTHYPLESTLENTYVYDDHAQGDQREKEWFTGPLRAVIGCQKDFDFNECSLPFKNDKGVFLN